MSDFEWKFLQQRPVNADGPKGFNFGSSHFLYINDFFVNNIHNTSVNDQNSALYSEYNQAFDKSHQLDLASDMKYDFRGIMDWNSKRLVDFNAD